ncbi:aminotransferase class V-fold PLP-dependent enzyme [Fluviispira multicolorata]|uniref:cysteine desulfurase n=1 Tax=Fluviispira multicolorata TaxID=2654512 RepID=A0A833JD49_9BACT|nr:aminotransferase class V-fold PLP-dependent enzyme [Fluviispira multicolorata]KAB8031076.1 aminotransferase class V-fold PLP-dependent enzyme [Fluviispira multicolorata]
MVTSLQNRIYFDCNATTPILEESCRAAICSMQRVYGNPSSTHMAGAEAKLILERSRTYASRVLNVSPNEIFFTSGATEAIQISVLSLLQSLTKKNIKLNENNERKILIASTEHKAVLSAVEHWCHVLKLNLPIVVIEVNSGGIINYDQLKFYAKDAFFLCTMAVNNETGVIHNLKKIESIIREQSHHIYWLVDCVQALGKIELDFKKLSVDYATFSAHKIHAPKGIGFLFLREGAPRCPLIVGGGQEQGVRSGTENLPGIAALGVILEMLNDRKNGKIVHSIRTEQELQSFRDIIVNALKKAFPTIEFNADFKETVATTINFSIFGLSSRELMNVFDAAGISVSGGSACNSKSVNHSHVLTAMKLPEWKLNSAIRLSFGFATTKDEINAGAEAILSAGKALRNSCINLTCNIENNSFDSLSLQDEIHGVFQISSHNANTWVLIDNNSKTCLIVDPTQDSIERVVNIVKCRKLNVCAILDTHSHADHESSRKEIFNSLQLNDNAIDYLGWPNNEDLLKFSSQQWIVKRISTPGHTLDSMAYLVYNLSENKAPIFAFTGDTILSSGLGRTDFGISGIKQFYETLHLLDKIFDNKTIICPAHDYDNSFATLWGFERKNNNLLAKALNTYNFMALEEFCNEKKFIDSQIALTSQQGQIICGLINTSSLDYKKIPIVDLETLLKENYYIIDIREKAESLLFKDWNVIGLEKRPMNIPKSQIVNLIIDLIHDNKSLIKEKIALVCSTGNRSLFIAKSLRRMGFDCVWSLNGGFAYSRLKDDEQGF